MDARFSAFAEATEVDVGPLSSSERRRLRIEIDALVALLWDLSSDDLRVILSDFTDDAVPPSYRTELLSRLEERR
ncbi:MAG: hypothetical protein F4151_14415 [Gammaproteobacteria bacterium]|nr:hypothetical protein [Gammaproteobacteria bacterium]